MCEPPLKRRAGGQRQRIAKEDEYHAQTLSTSKFADSLVEKWAWGEMSPQLAHSLAAAAIHDMTSVDATPPSDLMKLSGLGSGGRFPNNMQPELLAFTSKKGNSQDPYSFFLPSKSPWNQQLQTAMLPHMVLADLYHKYPSASFLDLQRHYQAFKGHPIVSSVEFVPGKTVPLAIHGDGRPVVGIGKLCARQMTTLGAFVPWLADQL